MDTCVACGAELGVGRFCLNCGHPIGAPAPAVLVAPDPEADQSPDQLSPDPGPSAMPVQAADPTPVPPVSPPDLSADDAAPDSPAAPAAPAAPRAATLPPRAGAPADARSEWDPHLDLLPYEEVDEPDVEAVLRDNAWIAWVVGALLLVALVLVLLQVFGTDGDELATDPTGGDTSTATPESSPAPEETTSETTPDETGAPQGVGRRLELATAATVEVPGTSPPTTDFDGNLVAYEGAQMLDGNPSTTWRTAGDATGQTVTLTLAQASVVNRVGLINGYAKQVAGVDWYPNNRRILAVTWGFDDGTTVEQTFAERPTMQLLKVPPVATGTVTITLTSATPPGSGSLGRDYTAISEVSIIGRHAG